MEVEEPRLVKQPKIPEKGEKSLLKFLESHQCYDLIPTSSKLVVFDTLLPVKKAFYALVANGLRAAPLWSSREQRFVGMLTITDFIMVLIKFYKKVNPDEEPQKLENNNNQDRNSTSKDSRRSNSIRSPPRHQTNIKMTELEEHTIDSWRTMMNKSYSNFISIDPECSLAQGLNLLIKHKIHRLPIVDHETGNPLYILTHKRILKFLKVCMDTHHPENSPNSSNKANISWTSSPTLNLTLAQHTIGTFESPTKKVLKIFSNQSIIDALNLFSTYRVSALPVIDEKTHKLVEVYSKFDVINLAAERTYHELDVSIYQALQYRKRQGRAVRKLCTCTLQETIGEIARKVVEAEVHRIIAIDENEKVIGIVSLSDLLRAMVHDDLISSAIGTAIIGDS